MLHLKLVDGSDLYVSSLAIRYVVPGEHADRCLIYYNASEFHSVIGDAKKIADTIHKAMHVIHLQS